MASPVAANAAVVAAMRRQRIVMSFNIAEGREENDSALAAKARLHCARQMTQGQDARNERARVRGGSEEEEGGRKSAISVNVTKPKAGLATTFNFSRKRLRREGASELLL